MLTLEINKLHIPSFCLLIKLKLPTEQSSDDSQGSIHMLNKNCKNALLHQVTMNILANGGGWWEH